MIEGIDLDHVAVAVEESTQVWPRYGGDLGGEWLASGRSVGFVSSQVRYANGMKVEVLEPHAVHQNDFLRRFLDRRGPGPHHLTFKVADIRTALAATEAAGYRPVSVDLTDPGWMEAFIHPKDAPGVVVQLAQSGAGEWRTDPPPGFPAPREGQARLVHVTHCVAEMKEGMRLFAELLGGQPSSEGSDGAGRWVDLAWPGPGRVRLVEPATWTEAAPGRICSIDFVTDDPGQVPGAEPVSDGLFSVPPAANLGVRLLLAHDDSVFSQGWGG